MILLSGSILPKLVDWYQQRFATSEQNGWLGRVPALPLLVLIARATEFITNSIINAIGLTTQNFLQMRSIHRSAWRWFIYPQLDRFYWLYGGSPPLA